MKTWKGHSLYLADTHVSRFSYFSAKMIYAYIRVSTDRQTVENQRFEIDNFCKARKIRIGRYIEETVSGMKAVDKRELGLLIRKMKEGDTLIASEISRLGRRLLEVMSILKMLMDKKVNVITVKEHFELGDNLQSHVIAFAFSLASEIERSLISQRTKEALARRKAMGQKLGRKAGGSNRTHKLDGHKELIRTMVEYGYNKAEICRKVGCTYATLEKHLKREGLTVHVQSRHRAHPVKECLGKVASDKPAYRKKKRKIVILSDSDRAIHVERKAAAWQHGRDVQREGTAPVPPILQEPVAKFRTTVYHHILFEHEKSIVRMLKEGYSKAYIARCLSCNIKTLDAHLVRMGIKLVWE